jgi:DNA-directed RNA polymerase subunit RPC12/RpoP
MLRWKIRGCSRCSGDVFIDKDIDGWYEQCLQCSYRRELKDLAQFRKQAVTAAMDKAIRWDKDEDIAARQ